MKRVSFHQLAERELNDAALYYERESPGLGSKFLSEVEHYVKSTSRIRRRARRSAGLFVGEFFESFRMESSIP